MQATGTPGRDTTPDVEIVGKWAMIPEWVIDSDVSPTALKLLAVIGLHGWKGRQADLGKPYLAERCHCSVTTVERALRELRDLGAIEIVPRYEHAEHEAGPHRIANGYRVLMHPPTGKSAGTPPGTDAVASTSTRTKGQKVATTSSEVVAPGGPPPVALIDRRNLPYDALAEVCGIQPNSPRVASVPAALNGTHSKPGIRALAWAEIVERGGRLAGDVAIETAIADLIRERAAEYERVMDGAMLTPTALLKWWVDLPTLKGRRGRAPDAMAGAQAAADELRRMT